MNDHHIIKKVEREGQCIYCNEKLPGAWKSSFASRNHYKCVVCKCGRENRVEVMYVGTGHDSWSELEKKVSSSKVTVLEPSFYK